MDMAKLLHTRMFNPEGMPEFQLSLQQSANYIRRMKSVYDEFMALSVEALHLKVRNTWTGRMGTHITPSLDLFMSQYVRPTLACEPGVAMKQQQLQRLLAFMAADPTTGPGDTEVVKAVVTGQVARHPAIHGILSACMNKLHMWKNGLTTMRNGRRSWPGIDTKGLK